MKQNHRYLIYSTKLSTILGLYTYPKGSILPANSEGKFLPLGLEAYQLEHTGIYELRYDDFVPILHNHYDGSNLNLSKIYRGSGDYYLLPDNIPYMNVLITNERHVTNSNHTRVFIVGNRNRPSQLYSEENSFLIDELVKVELLPKSELSYISKYEFCQLVQIIQSSDNRKKIVHFPKEYPINY